MEQKHLLREEFCVETKFLEKFFTFKNDTLYPHAIGGSMRVLDT